MNPICQIIEIVMWFIVVIVSLAIIVFELAVMNYIKEKWGF